MREETKTQAGARPVARAGKEGRRSAWPFWPLIGLFFLYEDYDAHVEKIRVPGTVVSVGPLNTTNTTGHRERPLRRRRA